jgi:hypothetical protein
MQQTTQVIKSTKTGANVAANLAKTVLCALLLCCSACFHHKIAIEDGFRLGENGGAPMLVPIDSQSSDAGNFRITTLVFSGGFAGVKDQAKDQCFINGEVFSLRSASRQDSRNWIVRSPSISGWNPLASKTDIATQWKIFTRDLERLNESGCFPSGLTTLEIRAAVARRIPLPAHEVPLFFYSDRWIGFADLAPEMEVRLERFVPTAKSISAKGPPRLWVASYDVIAHGGKGVGLKLTRKVRRGRPDGDSGAEERELLTLPQRFAQTPVLRLFLEGVYGTGQVSHGILIGAANQRQLDALTDLIRQNDPAKCTNYQETVCTEFPLGALSLFSTIGVNGRRTSCLFGSSLSDLLRSPPRPDQTMTLESLRVFRRANPDHYGEISFPRNEDGARQLLLLPGDKVESRH